MLPGAKCMVFLSLLSRSLSLGTGDVVVNEISASGGGGVCAGADWVELYNPTPSPINMDTGLYILYDSGGVSHESFGFHNSGLTLVQVRGRALKVNSALVDSSNTPATHPSCRLLW